MSFLARKSKLIPVSVASPRMARHSVIDRIFSRTEIKNYLIGHMPHSIGAEELAKDHRLKMIIIVRDPRDMTLSMLNHIRTRPQHHAYQYLFDVLDHEWERVLAVVKGYANDYGRLAGINQMYRSVLCWQEAMDVLLVKFENLVGESGGGTKSRQIKAINDVAEYLQLDLQFTPQKLDFLSRELFGKSKTFRKGKIGGWASAMDKKERDLFKAHAGDLVVNLGYEEALDW